MNYLTKFYQATGYKTSDDTTNKKIVAVLSQFNSMTRQEQESFIREYYSGEYVSLCIWMVGQPFDPQ
jgi:hypothetical protein